MTTRHRYHHYRSPFCLFLLLCSLAAWGYIIWKDIRNLDAFYFMSMIATAHGPMMIHQTAAGKIFASFMAFISVGGGVAALGFLFGPFFGKIWRIGVNHLEEELRRDKDRH